MSRLNNKLENRMLQNQLEAYLDDFGIQEKNISTAFEHFCNYCVFSLYAPEVYHSDNLFYQSVHTGKGGDLAIDGILILINDIPITSLEEAEEEINRKKGFTAKFYFVQAKTSAQFDLGEILKVGYGVKQFFKEDKLKANDEILAYKDIVDYIFENSIDFKENPTCIINYVTTGIWTEDSNLCMAIDSQKKGISELNYFSNVEFITIDAKRLMTIYKEINNSITREVVISKNVAFPEIKGAQKAFLGLISIREYMKLITDETSALLQGVFYDNVRGYLGDNPVNTEIISTLRDPDQYIQFPILNNGITIVAKNLDVNGDKFKLTDYQIVNGCQTSNALYLCKDAVNKDMMIPLKIVHSESPDLVNRVIRSTNRQTQVLDEAFESLKEFHKQLQDYYNSYKGENRIYYERRTHEYDDQRDLKRHNIITLPIQLQSFMSMFLVEPHSMHRYYGELLKNSKDKVFQPEHKLIAYYTAAKTLHSLEVAMNAGIVDIKVWKMYRYHMLLLIQTIVREQLGIIKIPFLNSKEIEQLCRNILEVLDNERQFTAVLHFSVDVLSKTLQDYKGPRRRGDGPSRKKEFTLSMLRNVKNMLHAINLRENR